LTRQMPGWPARLEFPDGLEVTGVISNIAYEETDDCGCFVIFDFEVYWEWYPTGRMVIA